MSPRVSGALVKVTVTDGVVTLAGEFGQKSMIPIAIRMTQAVGGFVDVTMGQLSFAVDDTHLPRCVDMASTDRGPAAGPAHGPRGRAGTLRPLLRDPVTASHPAGLARMLKALAAQPKCWQASRDMIFDHGGQAAPH